MFDRLFIKSAMSDVIRYVSVEEENDDAQPLENGFEKTPARRNKTEAYRMTSLIGDPINKRPNKRCSGKETTNYKS